jgi:hypothetical protein
MWHKQLPFILQGVVVAQCKKLHEKIQYPIIFIHSFIYQSLLDINKDFKAPPAQSKQELFTYFHLFS